MFRSLRASKIKKDLAQSNVYEHSLFYIVFHCWPVVECWPARLTGYRCCLWPPRGDRGVTSRAGHAGPAPAGSGPPRSVNSWAVPAGRLWTLKGTVLVSTWTPHFRGFFLVGRLVDGLSVGLSHVLSNNPCSNNKFIVKARYTNFQYRNICIIDSSIIFPFEVLQKKKYILCICMYIYIYHAKYPRVVHCK